MSVVDQAGGLQRTPQIALRLRRQRYHVSRIEKCDLKYAVHDGDINKRLANMTPGCADYRTTLSLLWKLAVSSRKSASRFVRAAIRRRCRVALLESSGKPIIHKGRSLVMEDLWNSCPVQARTSDRLHISLKYRSFLACQKILDRSLF